MFISSDQDEKSFEEYYKKMPWCAVPFTSNVIKTILAKTFQIRGIPSVIVMDGTNGKFISDNGRIDIMQIQGGDISKVKALVNGWHDIESVPVDEAKLSEGPGFLQQIVMTFLRSPILFILLYYVYKSLTGN